MIFVQADIQLKRFIYIDHPIGTYLLVIINYNRCRYAVAVRDGTTIMIFVILVRGDVLVLMDGRMVVWIVSYFDDNDNEATVSCFEEEEPARQCFEYLQAVS